MQGCLQINFIFNFYFLVLHVLVKRALQFWISTLLKQFLHDDRCLIEHRLLQRCPTLAVDPVRISLVLKENIYCFYVVEFN